MDARPSGSWRRASALVACALGLLWHASLYDFITDDAYIIFVYARDLAEHGTLTFNQGHPVEGYTTFLWTVMLAIGMWIGVPPELSSVGLGAAFAVATLWTACRWTGELSPSPEDERPLRGVITAALLASTASMACWTSGGLETQLFVLLVLTTLRAYTGLSSNKGGARRVGVFAALATLTRPEGMLLAAIVVADLGARRIFGGERKSRSAASQQTPRDLRDLRALAVTYLAIVVPHLVWRWWYYGYPLPNTYYAKAAGAASEEYLRQLREQGLYYLWQWLRHGAGVVAAPLVIYGGWVVARGRRAARGAATASMALVFAYLVYTLRVGGDFMGEHRFVLPVQVLGTVFAVIGGSALLDRGVRGVRLRGVIGGLLCLAFAGWQGYVTDRAIDPASAGADRGIDTPAYLHAYAEDRAAIGRHLKDCLRDDDFSILGGAGAKAYYGRVRGVDVFGLVSDRIAHEVPRTRPRPGHNKWAPDAVLLDFEPTLVFSCYSLHRTAARPAWNCSPSFWQRNGYVATTVYIPEIRHAGQFYSFWRRRDRAWQCPGTVTPPGTDDEQAKGRD